MTTLNEILYKVHYRKYLQDKLLGERLFEPKPHWSQVLGEAFVNYRPFDCVASLYVVQIRLSKRVYYCTIIVMINIYLV